MPEAWGGHSNGRIPLGELRRLQNATDADGNPVVHLYLRTDASLSIDRLLAKAGADGYDRWITDAYRTYATQVALKAQKGVYAATPGTSNHGWAMATDNAYAAGPKSFGRWLWANRALALEHGWYPPSWTHDGAGIEEPWHWEYDHALDRHRNEHPGAAGDNTEEAFVEIFKDDEGPAVRFWQRQANRVLSGGPNKPLDADGQYGDATAEAFQNALGAKRPVTSLGAILQDNLLARVRVAEMREALKSVPTAKVDVEAIADKVAKELTVVGKVVNR